MKVAVSEVFSNTIQGEGFSAGRLAVFVRLAGCPLSCSWCDSAYTWKWDEYDREKEVRVVETAQITADLREARARGTLLVITGGEPLAQPAAVLELVGAWAPQDVEIETAGFLAPPPWAGMAPCLFNVSPKLENAGNRKQALQPENLRAWAALGRLGRARFKFVVQTAEDVTTVVDLCSEYDIPLRIVQAMPEGKDPETWLKNLALLADPIVAAGLGLSPRLHLLAWGAVRGR